MNPSSCFVVRELNLLRAVIMAYLFLLQTARSVSLKNSGVAKMNWRGQVEEVKFADEVKNQRIERSVPAQ